MESFIHSERERDEQQSVPDYDAPIVEEHRSFSAMRCTPGLAARCCWLLAATMASLGARSLAHSHACSLGL